MNRSKLNYSGADATSLAGQYILALCSTDGVDILSCETSRCLQALRECNGATQVIWSSHLAHLAVYAQGIIHVYSYLPKSSANSPEWSHDHQIQISSCDNHTDLNYVFSFRYPLILVGHSDILHIIDCKSGVSHIVSGPYGMPNAAKLSSNGITLAATYPGSSRIDFLEVHASGCAPITHMDHSSEVRLLLWRPSTSQDRELFLSTDITNLIRIWTVDYRKSLNSAESTQIEVNLIIESSEYVGKAVRINWLAHGLATASETSFLSESPIRDISKRTQAMSAMPSGAWFTVLDEHSVIRLFCISSHSFSKHWECSLKGHGPRLEPNSGHRIVAYFPAGRFTSTGSDRPLAVDMAVIWDMDASGISFESVSTSVTSVTARHNFNMNHFSSSTYSSSLVIKCNRRLIQLLSCVTDRRPSGFLVHMQQQRDLLIDDEASHAIGPYTNHLPVQSPSNWGLKTWDTYVLDDSTPLTHVNRAVPKTFRAVETATTGPETALWNWSQRLHDSNSPNTPYPILSELAFGCMDMSTASDGFELTHDLLRSVWMRQPPTSDESYVERRPSFGPNLLGSKSSSTRLRKASAGGGGGGGASSGNTAYSREGEGPFGKPPFVSNQLLFTLQKRQLNNFVIAVWLADVMSESSTIVSLVANSTGSNTTEVLMGSDRTVAAITDPSPLPLPDTYECPITPDPHFGLGLRLDIVDGKILVESYKRNPLTMRPMPAEECGLVSIGDELLAINGNTLRGNALSDVIQTIRAVVQNARGADVVLQMRSCSRSEPSSPSVRGSTAGKSMKNLTVPGPLVDGPEAKWYAGSGPDSSLTSNANTANTSRNTAMRDLISKPTEYGEFDILVPSKPLWRPSSTWSLDDCLAVDIIPGSLGESLGDVEWAGTTYDSVLMVIAAVRHVLSNDGAHLELCVWELTPGACFQDRGSIELKLVVPWAGQEPYALQLWRASPGAFLVTGMTAGGGIIIYRLIVPHDSFSNTSRGVGGIGSGGSHQLLEGRSEGAVGPSRPIMARVVSMPTSNDDGVLDGTADEGAWSIGGPMCVQIVAPNEISAAHGYESIENDLIDKYVPLCPPLSDGSSLLVLGGNGSKTVIIAHISSRTETYLNDQITLAGDAFRSRTGSGGRIVTNSFATALQLPTTVGLDNNVGPQTSLLADVIQKLNFQDPVHWARLNGSASLQISAGSYLMTYSRVESGGTPMTWHLCSRSEFNSTDCPLTITSTPLDTPTPWSLRGGSSGTSKGTTSRPTPTALSPDWHPLSLLLALFGWTHTQQPTISSGYISPGTDAGSTPGLIEKAPWSETLFKSVRAVFLQLTALHTLLSSDHTYSRSSIDCFSVKSTSLVSKLTPSDMESLAQRVVPIAKQILQRVLKKTGKLSTTLIDPIFRSLRHEDIITLAVIILYLQSSIDNSEFNDINSAFNGNSDSRKALTLKNFGSFDIWATHAVTLVGFDEILNALMDGENRVIVRGTGVTYALFSSSQNELYEQFIMNKVNLSSGPGSKKGLQFGALWWARNQAGKDVDGQHDILRLLTDAMAAFWMHDLTPLLGMIEARVAVQFRDQRDAMQIFLEMIAIGRSEKLLLLSKTDKNVLGKQLQNLLSFDFTTDHGRNAARKNAYALLRLQRYRHAAAVFLCAEPPMLREATRIIVKNLNDPFLAFLIARLVEGRLGPAATPGGLVLGPVARNLLIEDILPIFTKIVSTGDTSGVTATLSVTDGVDAMMLGLVCTLWLQDAERLQSFLKMCLSTGIYEKCGGSLLEQVSHLFSVSGSLRWITNASRSPKIHAAVAIGLDALLERKNLPDLRYLPTALLETVSSVEGNGSNAFLIHCEQVLSSWKTFVMNASQQSKPAVSTTSRTTPVAADAQRNGDDLSESLKKLSKYAQSTALVDDQVQVEAAKPASKGFNLASESSMKPRAFEPSALDMFDAPPARAKPAPAPTSALDMFDAPPARAKPTPAPASALDMFDAPPARAKPAPAPASALDMFDAPPARAKPAPAPASALDMFDAPVPTNSRIKPTAPLVSAETVINTAYQSAINAQEDVLISQFCSYFAQDRTLPIAQWRSSAYASMILQACQHAIFTRSLLELNLSLGCPDMSHPLAVNNDVVGYIKVVIGEICDFRLQASRRSQAFLQTLEGLGTRFSGFLEGCGSRVDSQSTSARDSPSPLPYNVDLNPKGGSPVTVFRSSAPSYGALRLASFLVSALRLRRSLDCPAVLVLLLWAVGNDSDANTVILANIITIVELIPYHTDAVDPRNISNSTSSREILFGCLVCQLQLIMSVVTDPPTVICDALTALLAISIRLAVTFMALNRRYDVVLSLLKHPPKFKLPTMINGISDSAFTLGLEDDPGIQYFRRLSRSEAVDVLQNQDQGVFLLRPHDTQSDVIFLTFRGRPGDGVKHAIVRKDVTDSGLHSFRCGRVGPCVSLEETLRTIAKVLPSGLNFDKKLPSSAVLKSQLASPGDASDQHLVSSDPNSDFWDALAKVPGNSKLFERSSSSGPSTTGSSRRSRQLSLKRNLSTQLLESITNLSSKEGSYEGSDDGSSEEEYKSELGPTGSQQLPDMEPVSELDKQPLIRRRAPTLLDHPLADGYATDIAEEDLLGVGRGWTVPLETWRLSAKIQSVLHTLSVKAVQRQLAAHLTQLKDLLELEPDLEVQLRRSVITRLHRRLPSAYLPSPPRSRGNIPYKMRTVALQGQTSPQTVWPLGSPGNSSDGIAKQSDMDKGEGGEKVEGEREGRETVDSPLHIGVLESILTPLALYVCLSERLVHSALAPPLPQGRPLLLPSRILAGEALVQQLFFDKRGVTTRPVRVAGTGVGADKEQNVEAVDMSDVISWLVSHNLDESVKTVAAIISTEEAAIAQTQNSDLEENSADDSSTVGTSGRAESSAGSIGVGVGIGLGQIGLGVGLGLPEMTPPIASPSAPPEMKKLQTINEKIIKWLIRNRLMAVVQPSGGALQYQNSIPYLCYEDPWEVSVVQDQGTVLTSAKLGRSWLGPVSAHSAQTLVEDFAAEQGFDLVEPEVEVGQPLTYSQSQGQGFLKLWESLRAEAWLVMTISTALEQAEREKGGSLAQESPTASLFGSDPYHACLSSHLYRNALFCRMAMPHRFAAVLQVDVFGLKDLAPQKFRTAASTASMEIYSIIRLVRKGSRKAESKRGWLDTVLTPAKRVEPMRTSASSPSEYLWRDQAVMRFPLPEGVLNVGSFSDENGIKSLLQPPHKLQLSVFETRFFSDHKLGDLELPLSSLTDERALRDWLPLSSDKGSAWFVHVQLQLRFLLMAVDNTKAVGVPDIHETAKTSGSAFGAVKFSYPHLDHETTAKRLSYMRAKLGRKAKIIENGRHEKSSSTPNILSLDIVRNTLQNPMRMSVTAVSSSNIVGLVPTQNTNTNADVDPTRTSSIPVKQPVTMTPPKLPTTATASHTPGDSPGIGTGLTSNNTASSSASASPSGASATALKSATVEPGGVDASVGAVAGKGALGTNTAPGKPRFRPSAISRLEELGDFF